MVLPQSIILQDRSQLLTESAIGLATPKKDYFRAARSFVLGLPVIAALVRPIYLDLYVRIVDDEYGRFKRAWKGNDPRVTARVLNCVRSVAAFSAWETVSWAMVQDGFTLSVALGVAVALATGFLVDGNAQHWLFTAVPAAITLLSARTIALSIPRKWPRSGIVLTLLAGGAAIALVNLMKSAPSQAWWHDGLAAGLSGAIALWLAFAVALTFSAVFWIRMVARRISTVPEEEIIFSIAHLWTRLAERPSGWRSPNRRRSILEQLEWIARRFERQYVDRYTGHDRNMDSQLDVTARGCAMRFRELKLHVVFPSEQSYAAVTDCLADALGKVTTNCWDAIKADQSLDAQPSRRDAFVARLRSVGAIAAPLLVGAGFFAFGSFSDDIKKNILAMTVGWSLLAFIAMLDPKGFETQTKALESFGKLFSPDKK